VSVFLFQFLVFPAAINMLQNYPSWQLEITLSTDSFQSSEMSTVVVLDPGGGTLAGRHGRRRLWQAEVFGGHGPQDFARVQQTITKIKAFKSIPCCVTCQINQLFE
jgi:hypothetical protein